MYDVFKPLTTADLSEKLTELAVFQLLLQERYPFRIKTQLRPTSAGSSEGNNP